MLIQPNGKHNLGNMKANVILLTLYVILFTFLSLMNKLKYPYGFYSATFCSLHSPNAIILWEISIKGNDR